MKGKILFILFFLIICSITIQAKHIIGGVVYYEFLRKINNENEYKITMKIYRDCKPEPNKAEFDGLPNELAALGTIYAIEFGVPNLVSTIDFGTPRIKRLSVDITNQCLVVPPDVCVEEGVYETTVRLPIVQGISYIIEYQRCCRNETITNLTRPGDQGATYFAEISYNAMINQNSSPQFVNFPPIAICGNFPLVFDHSGIDQDGDSLSYELCSPFKGGGNNTNDIGGCMTVAPNPDCPPPFDPINYRAPFDANNPLGGDPQLSINPINGGLSGTPNELGQFVVGICMKEYRNGVLLSITRREFQFNVESCKKTVDAKLRSYNQEGKHLVIKVCGDLFADITNISTETQNIFNYEWSNMDADGAITTSTDASIRINFPKYGQYFSTMILNKGLPCSDTATIRFNVFPDIRADFSYDYDTCIGKIIDFENLSESDAGPITGSKWYANGNLFSSSFNAQYNQLIPDFYQMKLTVVDQNQCRDSITKLVSFFPLPKNELIPPFSAIGCEPFTVKFNNPGAYLTEDYNIVWDFGDGNQGVGVEPIHIYNDWGEYMIKIHITNVFGCEYEETFPSVITVKESPVAGFDYTPNDLSNFKPTMNIIDQSQSTDQWLYDFGDGSNSTDDNPMHTYQDTGVYIVKQIVYKNNGCSDTIYKLVDVEPKYTLYMPNAFTPDFDGKNDNFLPVGIPFGVKEFKMLIFDRYGKKMFETSDINAGWDGTDFNGQKAIPGVYTYKVEFLEPRGKQIIIYGTSTIVL